MTNTRTRFWPWKFSQHFKSNQNSIEEPNVWPERHHGRAEQTAHGGLLQDIAERRRDRTTAPPRRPRHEGRDGDVYLFVNANSPGFVVL